MFPTHKLYALLLIPVVVEILIVKISTCTRVVQNYRRKFPTISTTYTPFHSYHALMVTLVIIVIVV